jgi:hypothetical protein
MLQGAEKCKKKKKKQKQKKQKKKKKKKGNKEECLLCFPSHLTMIIVCKKWSQK